MKSLALVLSMLVLAGSMVYGAKSSHKRQNLTVTHYKFHPEDEGCLPCAEVGADTNCTDTPSEERCQCTIPAGQPGAGTPAPIGTLNPESCVQLWRQ